MRNFSFFAVKWYGKSRNCVRMCGFAVAPLVGAWIESQPCVINLLHVKGRTPRGCVD